MAAELLASKGCNNYAADDEQQLTSLTMSATCVMHNV